MNQSSQSSRGGDPPGALATDAVSDVNGSGTALGSNAAGRGRRTVRNPYEKRSNTANTANTAGHGNLAQRSAGAANTTNQLIGGNNQSTLNRRNNSNINNGNDITNHTTNRERGDESDTDPNGGNSGGGAGVNTRGNARERWPRHAIDWFTKIKSEIDKKVVYSYSPKEGGRFKGRMPLKYCGLISPSTDPLQFFGMTPPPSIEDFCLPNAIVWYPEAQYPEQYPDAKPCCKWHGKTDCVAREGWMTQARHGYASHRTTAIIGRNYECTIRRDTTKINPFSFRSIDPSVINQSPDYVKEMWATNGFDLSHRAAIEYDLLEHLRSDLLQGLGINPFRRSHLERSKLYHWSLTKKWRSCGDLMKTLLSRGGNFYINPQLVRERRVHFVDHDSDMYHQKLPSNSYLISRLIHLLEKNADYRTHRMQMLDGKHLSGDHSFKIAKCVVAGGAKAFTALYCIMNEFAQVVAFWFTTGTSMAELKEPIIKLKQRYELFGYDGPESVTTDRCCHERAFWKDALSLLDNYVDMDMVDDEDMKIINEVDMPYAARDIAYPNPNQR